MVGFSIWVNPHFEIWGTSRAWKREFAENIKASDTETASLTEFEVPCKESNMQLQYVSRKIVLTSSRPTHACNLCREKGKKIAVSSSNALMES